MPDDSQQQETAAVRQPVEKPILCSPYEEPSGHWVYNDDGVPSKQTGRRPAFYWYQTERTGSSQQRMFEEEPRDDLPLVNRLRADVRRWRESGYVNATPITKKLLRQWSRADLPRPLFFCQREAVETVIYLRELLAAGKTPRFKPELSLDDFERLNAGEDPSFAEAMVGNLVPRLIDPTPHPGWDPLRRYGCKMATGSGKTVVMAMLVAWALCNRGRVAGDTRFPSGVLVMAPNLTIKEQLQVLRPDHEDNYYEQFDLVPSTLMPELQKGQVLVENWHVFLKESENKAFDGSTHRVVQKGEETPEAFARKRLGPLYDEGPLLVLNDEAHHAYRPKSEERPSGEESKDEWEEATVWVRGLDKINQTCGIQFCMDLSATPFYLQGSGHIEGAPFP